MLDAEAEEEGGGQLVVITIRLDQRHDPLQQRVLHVGLELQLQRPGPGQGGRSARRGRGGAELLPGRWSSV